MRSKSGPDTRLRYCRSALGEQVQALEDVICFVFIQFYFAGFAATHPDDNMVEIVAKTARKMSAEGRARALAEFALPDALAEAIRSAGDR